MGVNMAGNCIIDDDVVCRASKDEIIRRYYQVLKDKTNGKVDDDVVYKMRLIMKQAEVTPEDRQVVQIAKDKAEETEITNFVSRFILNRSDIAFTYYANGKKILQSFGGLPFFLNDSPAFILRCFSLYLEIKLCTCSNVNPNFSPISLFVYPCALSSKISLSYL